MNVSGAKVIDTVDNGKAEVTNERKERLQTSLVGELFVYIGVRLKNLICRKRNYEEVKSCIDTMGMVGTFLIGFAILAVSSFTNSDWEVFKVALDACSLTSNQSELYTYDKIIMRYKYLTLLTAATSMMAIISSTLFHIFSSADLVEKPVLLNVFIIYLTILVGVTAISAIWIFMLYYDLFTAATSDICNNLPMRFNTEGNTIMSILVTVSALVPVVFFWDSLK